MATFKSEFEVKRLRCAGLNVHKKLVMAAIIDTDPETLEASYRVKKFSTMNDDILALKDWLLEIDCKYVRAIKGKKTDRRDANGLRTSSVSTSSSPRLSHLRTYVPCVSCPGIG